MAFWDRVREELKKAAHEGWEAVKGGAKVAAEKSEEVAKTSKLRYKAYTTHKKAEKLFTELGGIVYDLAKPPYENPLSKPEVMKLVEDIKKVEEETAKIEEEIERVKKRIAARPSEQPAPEEAPAEAGEKEESSEEGRTEEAPEETTEPEKEAPKEPKE